MRAAPVAPFLVPLLLAASVLRAQEPQDERPETYGHSHHGETFDEGPRSAAYLMPGMSEQVHFPVEGLSTMAQRFFDQGICQQHGFWYFEAERSFRQVAMMHPDCAMAYWGMARANDEDAERAAGFLANAVQRSANAPKRERQWIDAWARYYRIDVKDTEQLRCGDAERVEKAVAAVVAKNKERKKEDLDKLERRLIKDLGTIVFEYPDDIEAKAFLALQNWLAYRWGSGVKIVSHSAVDALLEQVFAKAPLHPAHHYRIHLWDQEDARRALDSAAKNGSTARAIAHQWHMPGHIYAKLNRHREAAWQQEASSRADHAHMMRDAVMPFLIHNYGHNQEWLARSLSHTGRTDDALAIACNLVELPRHPEWNKIDDRRSIAAYGRKRIVQICEDHGLWQRALDLVEHGYLERSDDVTSEVARLGLLGRAYYRLGRLDAAQGVTVEVQQLLQRARAARSAATDAAEDKAFEQRLRGKQARDKIAAAQKQPLDLVQSVLSLKRQLEAERLLASGDGAAALRELDGEPGVSVLRKADFQIAAGEAKAAIEALEKENDKRPNRAATMAALTRAYLADHPESRPKLRELVFALSDLCPDDYLAQLDIGVDQGRAVPAPGITLEVPGDGETQDFGDDFGERPPLASIGPRTWSPTPNPGFDLEAIDGSRMQLPVDGDGRARLVVFYLGFGCLHCVEQLHLLRPRAAEFEALGIDIVAIGADTAAGIRQAHQDLAEAERMPFSMLADPKREAFHAWKCFDDFEQMDLHGVFLIDARGRVRWQDISYEPFTELDWLLRESQRLLRLPDAAGSQR